VTGRSARSRARSTAAPRPRWSTSCTRSAIRQRRAMGPRRDRPRRADHGLRPPRLPRLRPARGRAPRRSREGMAVMADWLDTRSRSRTSCLRVLCRAQARPRHQDQRRVLRARPCCQGVGLPPELFPATSPWRAMPAGRARIEQASANKLIRPDMRYTGPGGPRPARLTPRGRPVPATKPRACVLLGEPLRCPAVRSVAE
jgi:hypothetical protein